MRSGYTNTLGRLTCTSTITFGPSRQYFCNLVATVTSTVDFLGGPFVTLTASNSRTSTILRNAAYVDRIVFISGSLGTSPWPTTTSSSTWPSTPDDELESAKVRAKTIKIAVGVAVPVAFALLVALILCCRRRKKHGNVKTELNQQAAEEARRQRIGLAPLASPATENQINLMDAEIARRQRIGLAPTTSDDQGAIFHVQPTGDRADLPSYDRAARLADLEAAKARVDADLERMRQVNALEQEQARLQGDIERLRRGR